MSRYLSKGIIALYCEGLWLYCGLALFAKTQWGITNLHPYWLIAAGLSAFGLQLILTHTWNNPWGITVLNACLVVGLLVIIWKGIPSGQWGYGIAASLVHVTLYIRSAVFALRPPTRLQMLSRFEGNLLFYLFYTLIFIYNPFMSTVFHLLFALAILCSLLGVVVSLHPEEHEEETIETKTVGETAWFSMIVLCSVAATLLLSLLLLLPSVREQLTLTLMGFWQGASQLGSLLLSALLWLLHLLPISETNDITLPEPSQFDRPLPNAEEEIMPAISLLWLYALAAGIGVIGSLWLINNLLRQRKPIKRTTVNRTKVQPLFPWKALWRWLLKTIRAGIVRIQQRFPSYYQLPIYWYYYQVAAWAKRNALPRLPHETVPQYMSRLGKALSKADQMLNQEQEKQKEQIQQALQQLGTLYAAAYYAQREPAEADFQPLITSLKKIKLKRRSFWLSKFRH